MASRNKAPGTQGHDGARDENGRYPNKYRYSDRFIRAWTAVLCTMIVVFPIAGIILLATSDSPDPQPVGMFLLVFGLAFPLLAGAVLGGNSIARGGGWIGALFFVGFAGVTVGPSLGGLWFGPGLVTAVTIIGGVLLALSVVGFWIIGWKAKVPMWLQLPSFGSPRLYVRGRPSRRNGGDPDRDITLPNELDGTH